MTDTLLASSLQTVDADEIDFRNVTIDRGKTLDGSRPIRTATSVSSTARMAFRRGRSPGTPTRSSPPRVMSTTRRPHFGGQRDPDSHDAEADAEAGDGAGRDVHAVALRTENADITLITWGSTYGVCRHAVDLLNESGESARMLHFGDVWPVPVDAVGSVLRSCRRTVVVEQNYTSQLAALLADDDRIRGECDPDEVRRPPVWAG